MAQAFDEQNIFVPYTKAIETDKEMEMGNISDIRKQRLQAFYAQPAFTEALLQEQPTAEPPVDYDEPEAWWFP